MNDLAPLLLSSLVDFFVGVFADNAVDTAAYLAFIVEAQGVCCRNWPNSISFRMISLIPFIPGNKFSLVVETVIKLALQ